MLCNFENKWCGFTFHIILAMNFVFTIIFSIMCVVEYNYNDLPPSIGYPKENTNNHTFGNCYIYDNCTIVKKNNTEYLEANTKYKLPTTYKTDKFGSNCPSYYELDSYYYMSDTCIDIGYGCCTLPLDVECAIRKQFEYNTENIHTVFLYKRDKDEYNNLILDIAKEDEEGINCPSFEKFLYLPAWKNNDRKTTMKNLFVIYCIPSILFNLAFINVNIKKQCNKSKKYNSINNSSNP